MTVTYLRLRSMETDRFSRSTSRNFIVLQVFLPLKRQEPIVIAYSASAILFPERLQANHTNCMVCHFKYMERTTKDLLTNARLAEPL